MKTPRWFVVGVGLVLLNFVAVTATVLSQQAVKEQSSTTAPELGEKSPPIKTEVTDEAPPSVAAASAANGTLPPGVDVPEIEPESADTPPSLADADSDPPSLPVPEIDLPSSPPEDDPVYQGIRKMIAEGMGSSEGTLLGSIEPRKESEVGIAEMRLRIEAVQRLNEAVLFLLEEAELHENRGRDSSSKAALEAAKKLRSQSAKLLSGN